MRQETRVNYLKTLEVCGFLFRFDRKTKCRLLGIFIGFVFHFWLFDNFQNVLLSMLSEQKQLVAQKIHIEENEDRDTGLEQRHYKEDSDCVMAKVPLGDLDLYDGTYISLESKDIRHVLVKNKISSFALGI